MDLQWTNSCSLKGAQQGPPADPPVKPRTRGGRKQPKWRQSKGPRPFDPGSAKAAIPFEEYLQRGLHVTEDARKHHRKILTTDKSVQKRINTINVGITGHGKRRNNGEFYESPKSMILQDLKKQEVLFLEAFKAQEINEESAVYLLTENHFLAKLLSGPTFHRCGLEVARLEELLAEASEWVELFRDEHAPSEEDVARSEATMRDIRSSKGWLQRTKNL